MEIFSDLSVVKTVAYLDQNSPHNSKREEPHSYTIKQKTLNNITKNINKAKKLKNIVEAYDGDAWAFIEFNDDGSIKWKRESGYIYGLKPLEKISKLLLNKKP